MMHAMPLFNSKSKFIGTKDYEDTEDSEVVVITAGIPRKPGMSRDDLLTTNVRIIEEITDKIVEYSPDTKIIVVTNPLDVTTYAAYKKSGLEKNKVMGMAGVLDSARFRAHILEKIDAEPEKVKALVLGTHGDTMVPIIGQSSINDKELNETIPMDKINAISERVKQSGAEVVSLMKDGSAYYAPASATAEMVRAILNDEKKILPCSCLLEGEYEIDGIFLGVPAVIGKEGVERIEEIELTTEENKLLMKSAQHVKEQLEKL